MSGRLWTEHEDTIVRRHYGASGAAAVREALVVAGFPRRGLSGIYQRAARLGLTVGKGSPEYRAVCRRRNLGKRASPQTEFKPGNTPWNWGKTGIHLSPATEFKPGNMTGAAAKRYKPVGTVIERKDKTGRIRKWIKTRDDGPSQYRYKPLAVVIWERERGPIPPGHHVVHTNGDTLDDSIENLRPMTRTEQIAWQRSIRPEMEINRRRATSAASRRRWQQYREWKAQRTPATVAGLDKRTEQEVRS